MSLFVGNISKYADKKEFENDFKNFGECKIDMRVIFKINYKYIT